MNSRFAVPVAVALAVLIIPATLITIVAHSPYTHSNLFAAFDPGYTRTQETVVGPPLLYRPAASVVTVDATAPIEDRGYVVFVARGCAGCHGLDGNGSVVGPKLVADIAVVRDNVRKGPGGMPVFSTQDVTDYDLTAIVAYIKSVSQ